MPKKRTFYSEEERKAHHEKKQREADLQIQELTKHWENDPKDIAEYLAFSTQFYKYSLRNTMNGLMKTPALSVTNPMVFAMSAQTECSAALSFSVRFPLSPIHPVWPFV